MHWSLHPDESGKSWIKCTQGNAWQASTIHTKLMAAMRGWDLCGIWASKRVHHLDIGRGMQVATATPTLQPWWTCCIEARSASRV